jgi:hypothetical protein
MSQIEVRIIRKPLRWEASLNGGIVARAWTLKGIQHRVDILAKLATFRDGKGTL